MNDRDTTAILSEDVLAATYEEDTTANKSPADADSKSSAPRHSRPGRPPFACPLSISVEPVIFFSTFSLALQAPLATQYLWDRISEDLGYNGTKSGGCANASAKHDPLQREVETLTAHWSLAINMGGFAMGLLVVTLLGSWSDQAGRRPVLILPSVGLALQAAVYLAVMYLKLPVGCFLAGRLLCGLFGDFNAVLAGCFAYVADTSDRAALTLRVAVLEACLGVAGMLAGAVGGKWRQAQGYINPFWLVLASNLAAALYAYLFIPESVTPDPGAKLFASRHHRAIWRLYASGGRAQLRLYALCFFVVVAVHYGCRELLVLYQLSAPLCWGPALIGYGSTALHLAYLSSLLGLKVLQRCLKDPWVALAGLASNMAGLVAFSVADTTLLMFIGYGLCFLFMAGTPVIRSKMSKLVGPSEQGALFASVACVEGLCGLVANGVFNSLYPATLHFMKGFTFLFAAVLLVIPSAIIGTLECRDQRRDNRETSAS